MPPSLYVVSQLPSTEHATSNLAYVRRGDPLAGHNIVLRVCDDRGVPGHQAQGVYPVEEDDKLTLPPGVPDTFSPLGLSNSMRKGASVDLQVIVKPSRAPVLPNAEVVQLSVTRIRPKAAMEVRYETADLEKQLRRLQGAAPAAPGRAARQWPANVGVDFFLTIGTDILQCQVVAITAAGSATSAQLTPATTFTFEATQAFVKIAGQNKVTSLFKRDFDVSELGIGGLDKQFSEIFRGAFASRAVPPHVVKAMNIQHTKGILLYGPPGTGKTLIARQIGKLLNAVEPKVVNGPEVLDKYVGESEKKVRELFADAERDEAELKEESPLHVIIFDEIDAICRQRGSMGGGTGVHDSIVNTLLTKIDGVDSLNNILLIGMTNRPDLLDEALTRPGRIELKIEIGLPDERGRLQILNIHTKPLKKSKCLKDDVDLQELAGMTKNFTGAELKAVVRRATNWALDENLNKKDLRQMPKDFQPVVERRHFMITLERDIKPAFGAPEESLAAYHREGIFHYGARFDRIVQDIQSSAKLSEAVPKSTILLNGAAGTGKTALATYMAMQLKFPFVKMVDFMSVMGRSESAASDVLKKAFDDAVKSPLSVLILDDLAKLIQYAKHGPRYSLLLLHTLQFLLKQRPPADRRLVVIATADMSVARTLELKDSFMHTVQLPTLTHDEAVTAVQNCSLAPGRTLQTAARVMPNTPTFAVSIRTLTSALLNSSPDGELEPELLQQWKHVFDAQDAWADDIDAL